MGLVPGGRTICIWSMYEGVIMLYYLAPVWPVTALGLGVAIWVLQTPIWWPLVTYIDRYLKVVKLLVQVIPRSYEVKKK